MRKQQTEELIRAHLDVARNLAESAGWKGAYNDLLKRVREAIISIRVIAHYNSGTGIHCFEPITDKVSERVCGIFKTRIPELGNLTDEELEE